MVNAIEKNASPASSIEKLKLETSFRGRVWKWLKKHLPDFIIQFFSKIFEFFGTRSSVPAKKKKLIDSQESRMPSCGKDFSPKAEVSKGILEVKQDLIKPEITNPPSLESSLLSELPKAKQIKIYQRSTIEYIDPKEKNFPFSLGPTPSGIQYFTKDIWVHTYFCEAISDGGWEGVGWGCAWRTFQTVLSGYKIEVSFEDLFHLFGSKKNLELIYKDKYGTIPPCFKGYETPYDSSNGWAEPFICEMALHFYKIPSQLESLHGVPNGKTPKELFPKNSLNFETFRKRLQDHFKNGKGVPVVIDDTLWSLNIVGIGCEGKETVLWIADPHINSGVNRGNTRVGLYTITLDETGKKIDSSLYDEDAVQLDHLYASHQALEFDSKKWMILFPL